jgi:hypothetical protein
MSKPTFVGFQENFEIPEGYGTHTFKAEFSSALDKDQLFSLLSEAQLMSKWFYQIISFDSKPSGKINYLDKNGTKAEAICTSFILGKEVSFISKDFGSFTGKVNKGKEKNSITLTFTIITDKPVEKKEDIEKIFARMKEFI